jgi:hypothetical protein
MKQMLKYGVYNTTVTPLMSKYTNIDVRRTHVKRNHVEKQIIISFVRFCNRGRISSKREANNLLFQPESAKRKVSYSYH